MNSRPDLQKWFLKVPEEKNDIDQKFSTCLRGAWEVKTPPGWDPVRQGFPNPGPQTWLVSGLVGRNQASAGGEWWAKEPSFICICSHSLLLVLPPELRLLSDQQWCNKRNALESSWSHPPALVCGKTIFHQSLVPKMLGTAALNEKGHRIQTKETWIKWKVWASVNRVRHDWSELAAAAVKDNLLISVYWLYHM